MWVYDLETLRFLAVNEAAIRHYGYSRGEFLSMTIAEIRPPEDIAPLQAAIIMSDKPYQESGIWRHLKHDETTIDVEITSHELPFAGRAARLVLATDVTERLALERVLQLRSESLTKATRRLQYIIVEGSTRLARACEHWDPMTGQHLERVMTLTQLLALEAGLPEPFAKEVSLASIVHDVGKITVPPHILTKPGRLTDEEFAIIKRHPITGLEIIADAPEVKTTRDVVRHHHENYDGTGYPDGLAGEKIPLAARIVRVADSFDAIVSERPYKPARSTSDAIREINRMSAKQFDPEIVRALNRLFSEGKLAELQRNSTLV
jgi:PAS domain S-box-containing protein